MLAQHFGAVRFVYNWGLETKKKAWEESGERIGKFDLQRQLTILKQEKDWLNMSSRPSLEATIGSLEAAFQGFFTGKGYPCFKKRQSKQACEYRRDIRKPTLVDFDNHKIRLPKIGPVETVISQRFEGILKTVTVTKTPTGKYFASCLVEVDINPAVKPEPVESDAIGIDLGIKTFAVLSDGETIENPRFLNKSLKALRRVQCGHSKKKKGGKNREKSRLKLARLHEKVANQRNDFLHKVTTKLTRENQAGTICIEDLNVSGMVKNHTLARHIQDVGFATFRELLTYKANWYGKNVLVIDRFAPSSKQCTCGHKNTELKLSQRTWTCKVCLTTHDRDLLAAQNIVRFAFHPETIVKKSIGRGTPEFTPVETLALAGL